MTEQSTGEDGFLLPFLQHLPLLSLGNCYRPGMMVFALDRAEDRDCPSPLPKGAVARTLEEHRLLCAWTDFTDFFSPWK